MYHNVAIFTYERWLIATSFLLAPPGVSTVTWWGFFVPFQSPTWRLHSVFHRTYGLDGHLFRGRYKSILVDSDAYLPELLRYIHNNPIEAGIVDRLESYQWSSHKGYLSRSKKWNRLHKNYVLKMFSNNKDEALYGTGSIKTMFLKCFPITKMKPYKDMRALSEKRFRRKSTESSVQGNGRRLLEKKILSTG